MTTVRACSTRGSSSASARVSATYSPRVSRRIFLESTAREVLESSLDEPGALALLAEKVSEATAGELDEARGVDQTPPQRAREMNELFFPVFGPLLILVVVVPLCALAGKAGLAWLDRASTSAAGRFGTLRYLLLVAPPFLPVAWAISAGVHQAESGRSVLSCLVTHDFEELCVEPLLFAGLLSLLVAARVIPELVRTLRASSHRRAGSTPRGRASAPVARRAFRARRRSRSGAMFS